MHKAILTRQDFYKRTELLDSLNSSYIDLANNHFANNTFNDRTRFFIHFLIGGSDEHTAILFDIDLDASLFDDLVNDLTTCADYITDLVRINEHRDNLWCIL
ncbi:hypothetical protein D1872_310120 [compost metagenome]